MTQVRDCCAANLLTTAAIHSSRKIKKQLRRLRETELSQLDVNKKIRNPCSVDPNDMKPAGLFPHVTFTSVLQARC